LHFLYGRNVDCPLSIDYRSPQSKVSVNVSPLSMAAVGKPPTF
jgi:hypothetical protein